MISKTKIKARSRRKTNPQLEETIALATKNSHWLEIAKLLSSSTRAQSKINLRDIDPQIQAGDTIVVPGKVLSQGNLTKKARIVALSISSQAKEKLQDTKSEFATILEEIQKNKKAEGIKIIK